MHNRAEKAIEECVIQHINAELWCHSWLCQQLLRAMMPSYDTVLIAQQAEWLQGQIQPLPRQEGVWPGGGMQWANHGPMWEAGMARVNDSQSAICRRRRCLAEARLAQTHTNQGEEESWGVWWQNPWSVSEQGRWRWAPSPLRMASPNIWLAKGWVVSQVRLIKSRS